MLCSVTMREKSPNHVILLGLPGGPVGKILPSNGQDAGSVPGWERSHLPQGGKKQTAKQTKQIELIKRVKLNLSFKRLDYLNIFIYLD